MNNSGIKKIIGSTDLTASPYYPTPSDCIEWTSVLNSIMYQNTIPPYKNVHVRKLRGGYRGWCEFKLDRKGNKYCNLVLDHKFDTFSALYTVLAHELIHAAEYHKTDKIEINHGKYFFSHKKMLANIGINLKVSY